MKIGIGIPTQTENLFPIKKETKQYGNYKRCGIKGAKALRREYPTRHGRLTKKEIAEKLNITIKKLVTLRKYKYQLLTYDEFFDLSPDKLT